MSQRGRIQERAAPANAPREPSTEGRKGKQGKDIKVFKSIYYIAASNGQCKTFVMHADVRESYTLLSNIIGNLVKYTKCPHHQLLEYVNDELITNFRTAFVAKHPDHAQHVDTLIRSHVTFMIQIASQQRASGQALDL